jgi:hypothetical protein
MLKWWEGQIFGRHMTSYLMALLFWGRSEINYISLTIQSGFINKQIQGNNNTISGNVVWSSSFIFHDKNKFITKVNDFTIKKC